MYAISELIYYSNYHQIFKCEDLAVLLFTGFISLLTACHIEKYVIKISHCSHDKDKKRYKPLQNFASEMNIQDLCINWIVQQMIDINKIIAHHSEVFDEKKLDTLNEYYQMTRKKMKLEGVILLEGMHEWNRIGQLKNVRSWFQNYYHAPKLKNIALRECLFEDSNVPDQLSYVYVLQCLDLFHSIGWDIIITKYFKFFANKAIITNINEHFTSINKENIKKYNNDAPIDFCACHSTCHHVMGVKQISMKEYYTILCNELRRKSDDKTNELNDKYIQRKIISNFNFSS